MKLYKIQKEIDTILLNLDKPVVDGQQIAIVPKKFAKDNGLDLHLVNLAFGYLEKTNNVTNVGTEDFPQYIAAKNPVEL